MSRSPLRSDLSRYRKRKQLSLDGTVAGIDYSRSAGHYVDAPLPSAGPVHLYEHPAPADYAPHAGLMQFDGPAYADPAALPGPDTIAGHPTQLPMPIMPVAHPPDMIPESVSYDHMLMADRTVEDLQQEWQALHDEAYGTTPTDNPGTGSIEAMFHAPTQPFEASPYHSVEMTQELFEHGMELAAGTSMPASPADAIPEAGLEDIVMDAEPPVPPPEELQPDPRMMDPFEDPLMRQMMNPFGM